jgi:trypanothione synthetase/amidase
MKRVAGKVPFGEVQGTTLGGIKAYSNGTDMFFSATRNIDGNIMTGFRWQCVEFARRWLLERKGVLLPDVAYAAHIFEVKTVNRVSDAERVPMVAVPNGSEVPPTADSLLIYPVDALNPVGHVAVIVEAGENYVRVADQNRFFHKWESYSAEFPVEKVEGKYYIRDPFVPMGWMTFPESPNRDTMVPLQFHSSYEMPKYDPIELDRVVFTPKEVKESWLDASNPAEKIFIDTFGIDLSRTRLAETQSNYYTMNVEMVYTLIRVGNELHNMCLQATERVLSDDTLLAKFGVPQFLWPKIRQSFETQPYCITGRFDFAIRGQEVKMYEYNADSASTLLECAVIQNKWAEAVGIADGSRPSGWMLPSRLEYAWECTGLKGTRLHLLVDNDDEERYTAEYVAERARKVGIDTRVCVMFDDLYWKGGKIVDGEGVEVKSVWKTWMWETAISDYNAAVAERKGEKFVPVDGTHPRLADIFLGDLDLKVFEPLWKIIPSNKAILPVLWSMFPDHPNLLRTEWEVTNILRQSGYARKPIVGRCGKNITIVDAKGEVAKESDGEFATRDFVYQELFPLPKFDEGYHALLGGWIIGDIYAGTGIREDKTIITNVDSPFSALRIALPKDWGKPKQ